MDPLKHEKSRAAASGKASFAAPRSAMPGKPKHYQDKESFVPSSSLPPAQEGVPERNLKIEKHRAVSKQAREEFDNVGWAAHWSHTISQKADAKAKERLSQRQPVPAAASLDFPCNNDKQHHNKPVWQQEEEEEAPGAVRVQGMMHADSVSSSDDSTKAVVDNGRRTSLVVDAGGVTEPAAMLEAVVVDDDDVRERVRKELLDSTVKAEVVPKRRVCKVLSCLGVVAVMVVTVVLAVVLSSNSSVQSTQKENNVTRPPQTWTNCTADFAYNSSANIYQLLAAASNHTVVTRLLEQTGVSGFVNSSTGEFTFFAPYDTSFQALLPPYTFYYLPDSMFYFHLQKLLEYHIAVEPMNTSSIFSVVAIPTETGVQIPVNASDWTLNDNQTLVCADIPASNGFIQVPNGVLVDEQLRRTMLDIVFNITTPVPGFELQYWKELIQFAKMEDTLLGIDQYGYTMFAPNDYSFVKLGDRMRNFLLTPGNEGITANVIRYHLTRGVLYPSLIANLNSTTEFSFPTLSGTSAWYSATIVDLSKLAYSADAPYATVYANTAKVLGSLFAGNGYVNIIDQVLIPPNIGEMLQIMTARSNKLNATAFLNVVEGLANLTEVLTGNDNLTLFCPQEDALVSTTSRFWEPGWLLHLQSVVLHQFTKQAIRFDSRYQFTMKMLSGFSATAVQTSQNKIVTVDNVAVEKVKFTYPVKAFNGFIYFMKGVLLPQWTGLSIVEQVQQDIDLSTSASFISLTNLTSLLTDEANGPLTFLCPNDAAWSTWSSVFSTANVTLVRDTLARHIVVGNLYLSSKVNDPAMEGISLNNNYTWTVERVGNSTYVGGVLVLQSDILASNGVVHVIDRVLADTSI